MGEPTTSWAMSYLRQQNAANPPPELDNYAVLVQTATRVWGLPDPAGRAYSKLEVMKQWKVKDGSTAQLLAAMSHQFSFITAISDEAKKRYYYNALKDTIKNEMSHFAQPATFDEAVHLAQNIETNLERRADEIARDRPRQSFVKSTPSRTVRATKQDEQPRFTQTKIVAAAGKLSGPERQRYFRDKLCFNCGLPNHISKDCPTRPKEWKPKKFAKAAVVEEEEEEEKKDF
jgi:hypothetical protein